MKQDLISEIDFVVVREKKPVFAVECKTGENKLSRNIAYFAQRSNIPLFYQAHTGHRDYAPERERSLDLRSAGRGCCRAAATSSRNTETAFSSCVS